MSRGACRVLGTVLLVAACGFLIIALTIAAELPLGTRPFWGFAVFSATAAWACFSERSRPFTLRVIGTGIASVSGWFLWRTFGDRRMIGAICFAVVIGIPAAYLAVTARYPEWGQFADVFGAKTEDPGDGVSDESAASD